MNSAGVEVMVAVVNTATGGALVQPKPGNLFLNVQVVVKSVDRDQMPYNPLYFVLKDRGGFEYNTNFFPPDPSFKSGTLNKGEIAAGWLAFEVPTTAGGFVLTYQPLVIFGGYQPLRVDLGR